MRPRLFFRTDASPEIGMGHFSRCIGMADMLAGEFDPVFVMQQFTALARGVCKSKNYELVILPQTPDSVQALDETIPDNSLVIIDGYHLVEGDLQPILKSKNCKMIFIDDIHQGHFYADVIINCGGADEKEYSKEPHTKLYQGLEYAVLKREFIEATQFRSKRNGTGDILIAMGGTDPDNYSPQFAAWLMTLGKFENIQVLTTSANKNLVQLVDFCNLTDNVQIHFDLPADDIVDLIKHCDVAILPASTICMEASAVGIGIICGIMADNQQHLYDSFVESGAAIGIGQFNLWNKEEFARTITKVNLDAVNKMIDCQKSLIDGKSAERITGIIKGLC